MGPGPLRDSLFLLLFCFAVWFLVDRIAHQRDTARRERDSAQFELTGLREAARINGERLAARDEIDHQRTQELTHARTENDRLRRAVDAGSQRLFVKATCPGPMPADASTGRVADAGAAELAADARPDYFTLIDQLALTRQMILGLQDHVRRVCLR